jgi:UPF0755 protein
MTRHRGQDPDEVDGDAPWRARDYDQGRPAEPGGGYYPAPWSGPAAGAPRPARGALSPSGGREDSPGEETGPPWELPGWNEAIPAQRRPRDDGAHPSGPLPQVNSGPMPRVPDGTWPPAISGPLPPVPREPWPARSGRPAGRRESGPGAQDDTSYLRTGPRYGGAALGSGEYPAHGDAGGPGYPGAGYDDPGYGDSFPARGGHVSGDYPPVGGDYPRTGYDDEPGYHAGPSYGGGPDYPGERGYSGGGGYPGGDYPADGGYAGPGYAGDDDYPGQPGYDDEPGYPDQGGYPARPDNGYPARPEDGYDDTGYHQPPDNYLPGHDQQQPHRDRYGRALREDPDHHGYGDGGGWYGDVEEDQAWGDDEDDSGLLPGFSGDGDLRGDRGRGPAGDLMPPAGRGGRKPPSRPRGGKPKRKSAMRRAAPWIALTVLVIVLAVAGGGFFYLWHHYLHPADYTGPGTGTVTVQVKSGETATEVGQQLLNQGVVASVRAFSNAAKASGHGSALQPGYYRLHKHMAATLAFALLLKPSSRIQRSVLIIEGKRLSEILATLGQDTGNLKGYQQAIKDVSALGLPSYAKGNPEGYLFPATYPVQPGTQPIQVLRAMVLRFNREATSVNLPAVAAHDQISEGDAITVASLVQAEGRRPQDLAKIARVIYNRLNQNMKLQLDTTVLYARNSRAADVTVAQTQNTKSPYNTYLHAGLPPGPIDSPGDAAIRAALHPAKGTWTYFLTVNPNTGLTKFTDNYATFLTYVQELNAYNASHH